MSTLILVCTAIALLTCCLVSRRMCAVPKRLELHHYVFCEVLDQEELRFIHKLFLTLVVIGLVFVPAVRLATPILLLIVLFY